MSDEQRRELYAYPGEADGQAAAKEGGRDQADIARLLRALNDDLRDDAPPSGRTGAQADAFAAAAPLRPSPSARAMGGKPSTIAVGVAVVAAAAIGLGSILFSGPSAPNGGGEPPNLIVPSGGTSTAAPSAQSPSVQSPSAQQTVRGAGTAGPAQPVAPPPIIPPSAASAPTGMLTPGQTATIVRPQTDPGTSESATVVVQPLAPDAGPAVSATAPAAPPRAPSPAVAPGAAAKPPAVAAPVKPAPAPAPAPAAAAPASKTPQVGGAGNWAVQVGTFSVSANAEQLARRLSQNGRQAYVVDWQDRQGRTWKAVRVGNFSGEAAARGAAAQLKTEMNLSGQVIDLR